jgi:hypothetical protein
MKKRFREAVEEVQYEDLVKMRNDLENGGNHLKALIDSKIKEIERKEVKVCAVCGAPINPHFIDDYRLEFGRYDFKKRAYFCGLDCLDFFMVKLKNKEKEKLVKRKEPPNPAL